MPTFEPGTVVRVPFPYTNRPVQQRRPAVVVSTSDFSQSTHLLWVIMITSAENRAWAGDVPIPDHAVVGLPAPSVIRTAKIATIEAAHAEAIGTLGVAELATLNDLIRANLAIHP
jgi:mRNA interferase MazF